MITNIKLNGLHCAACQKIVEKRVKTLSGVEEVNVSLDGEVKIVADRVVDSSDIIKVLEGTPYQVV